VLGKKPREKNQEGEPRRKGGLTGCWGDYKVKSPIMNHKTVKKGGMEGGGHI